MGGGEDLLRLIVDDAPELIVAFDPQRRFVSINRAYARAFAEVFGRPVTVGQTIDEALAHVPAEQATARALWDRALAGEEFTVERSFATETGESHLFELTYRPLRGADGHLLGGSIVGRDIADRRAAEIALVNRNEELSQSLRIARIGTWKWVVGEPAMRWSSQTYCMMSIEPGRPVPTFDEMASMFEPESYHLLRGALDKAADEGNAFEIDLTAILPYRQRRQFTLRCEALRNADGQVTTLRGTIQDITERWRAEETLRSSDDRWRFAIESTGDAVWDWNIADGHVYVSPRWKEMLGHAPDDPIGSGFEDWRSRIHADDEPRVMHALLSHLSGASESYTAEYRLRAKDGSMRWILDRGRVIARDDSGRPTRMIGTQTDVSVRHKAEEDLARTQADYQLVVDSQNELICKWQPDTTLTFVNEAYCRHFGLREDRLIGTRFLELVPAAERYAVELMIERILTDKRPASYEHPVVTTQGELRWHLWKDTPLLDEHGQVRELLSVGIDITDRKRTEEALRASEARFAAFMDNCPASAWTTDRDGLMSYANATYRRMFFVGDPTGRRRQDIYPPHLAAQYQALDDQVLRENRTIEKIEDGLRSDGTPGRFLVYKFPTQGNDGRTVVGGMALDITEREAAERELRAILAVREVLAKASSRLINMPADEIEGVMATTLEQLGRLMEADRAWMFRYDQATGLANNTIEWCAEGIRPEIDTMQRVPMSTLPWLMEHLAVRQPLAIDSLDDIPASETTLREILAAQDIRSLLMIPVHTGTGLEGFIGFDSVRRARVWRESETQALELIANLAGQVIDRQRAEAERERLQSELLQAQKMESVGRLAGGVAHDFNNMLTVILGHVAMALNQVPPGSPLHADLCEVRDAAQRSSNLTRQLLAFARKQRVAPQVLDVNATIGGLLRMMRRLIGEGIELEWNPGGNLWHVCMDPSQVDQVLANLMANARDALGGSGRIAIATENVSIEAPYKLGTPDATAGDFVRLTVSDNGPGMSEATRANLFEPFFTTKEPGKGTGLGLATVYGTVRQIGGFITVESTPDHGSTFAIHLPRTDEPLPDSAIKDTPAPEAGSETVLVAEDEVAILQLTRRILSRAGYTVLAANSPQEACQLAERHGGPIDLLITDVVMPGMSGSQLKAAVRRLRPGLRTIYVSGYSATEIASDECDAPDFHYLQKPFTVEALLRAVREVLDGPG